MEEEMNHLPNEMCKSCGMPVSEDAMKGSNENGSKNEDYCTFCFKEGKFTFEGSLEEFIEKQVKMAVEKVGVPEDQAREMAKDTVPHLERWKK